MCVFETGPEGPELEDLQAEKKSKAAQTRPKKLIRRTFLVLNKIHDIYIHVLPSFGRGADLKGLYRWLIS